MSTRFEQFNERFPLASFGLDILAVEEAGIPVLPPDAPATTR